MSSTFTQAHTTYPVASSVYDNLFKAIVSAGWCVKSDGNVDAPCGYFAMVEIPSHYGEKLEMTIAVDGEPLEYDWSVPSGWYFTVQNTLGQLWAFKVPGMMTAKRLYEAAEAEFAEWSDDEVEEIADLLKPIGWDKV